MAEFSEMTLKDYGVKKKPITVRNPQANSIIERIHQTIGNMIGSFEVHSTDIDEKDPWTCILSAVRFATRATVHTSMQATPTQLVFDRDTTLNVKHESDSNYIKKRGEELIRKNNEQENKKRKTHNYQIGGKVMLKGNRATKYGTNAYSRPYPIEQINNNGTVKIRMNKVTDVVNLKNIKPYHE
eukprot:6011388-Ditylum_brightwellii.AAC.1